MYDRQQKLVYEEVSREERWANLKWHKNINSQLKVGRLILVIHSLLLPLENGHGTQIWELFWTIQVLHCTKSHPSHHSLHKKSETSLPCTSCRVYSCSPTIKMKFSSPSTDWINGNEMCHQVIGKNASKPHKAFQTFFTIQDPRIIIKPGATDPNFKVDPFLNWIQVVSMEAFD